MYLQSTELVIKRIARAPYASESSYAREAMTASHMVSVVGRLGTEHWPNVAWVSLEGPREWPAASPAGARACARYVRSQALRAPPPGHRTANVTVPRPSGDVPRPRLMPRLAPVRPRREPYAGDGGGDLVSWVRLFRSGNGAGVRMHVRGAAFCGHREALRYDSPASALTSMAWSTIRSSAMHRVFQ
jgi:hypothetical protein